MSIIHLLIMYTAENILRERGRRERGERGGNDREREGGREGGESGRERER